MITSQAGGGWALKGTLNWICVTYRQIIKEFIVPEDSPQVLEIQVEDVDERPDFENGPKPYRAVVPTNVPIGYTVYKFTARDEGGEGDQDVKYQMVGAIRKLF